MHRSRRILQLPTADAARMRKPCAHTEPRRGAVEWINRYEGFVRLRRIVIAELAEIVLTETRINAVLIGAIPELGEVFRQGLRPAEVAEAQTDHSERIRDTAIIVL